MKIGITGWEGFIGSKLMDGIEDPVLFEGDLSELDRVKEFVSKCDRIYHMAGLNREDEGKILSNNLQATGNLVLSCKLLDQEPEIVFASTKQVEWNPDSEYGFTKSVEEDIIRKLKKWSIFRIPNVYGPGGQPFYNSVVATFTYQIAKGEEVTINDPDVTRQFIFIDDLIEELLKPRFNEMIFPKGEVLSIGDIHHFLTDRLGEHEKLKRCLDHYTKEE